MTTPFENAMVGERVWSSVSGWGTITAIDGSKYPLTVYYDAGGHDTYTVDGLLLKDGGLRVLFWDEVPQKPLPDLEIDTKVLVWDNEGTKHNRYFAGWSAINRLIMVYDDGATSWSAIGFSTWPNWELAE